MLPNVEMDERLYFTVLWDSQKNSEEFGKKFLQRGNLMAIDMAAIKNDSFFYDVADFFSFMITFGFYKLEKNHVVVRRLVGLPGEYIKIINKKIYINDKEYFPSWELQKKDPRTMSNEGVTRDNVASVYIPQGYVYVLGDNWDLVSDSRDNFVFPFQAIMGIKKK